MSLWFDPGWRPVVLLLAAYALAFLTGGLARLWWERTRPVCQGCGEHVWRVSGLCRRCRTCRGDAE